MKKSIAFVGAGNACLQMIKLFQISDEYIVKVICDKNFGAPAMEYARTNKISTVRNISEIPNFNVNFLIELTGKNKHVMDSIENNIPKDVCIIDSDGANMFFSLFSLMWEEKSNETSEILEESTNELSKYFQSFYEVQNNINLLSLNASIEAKKAGEAGAGFSAIARAIKDLVVQSEKTTKDCKAELLKMEKIKANLQNENNDFLNMND